MFPDGFEVVRTPVAVVDVIGVFPYIECHERFEAAAHGISCIGFGGDDELSFLVHRKPAPAGTELGGCLGYELVAELFGGTEVAVDEVGEP